MQTDKSRQSFLGNKSTSVIQQQHIGIIGLCGGGSHVAQQCAHIGFETLSICDFDKVEDSNVPRMVGSRPSDAEFSELKTHVIERMIKSINPYAKVNCLNDKWQVRSKELRNCDVIFGCVDTLIAREELEKFCRRYSVPYIDIGMDVHEVKGGYAISGQVATSLPGGHCLRCMGLITDEGLAREQAKYGAVGGRPQVIWPNGALASTAIAQLMSIILPWNSNLNACSLLEYDGNQHCIKPSTKLMFIDKQKCRHFDGFAGVGDPFFCLRSGDVEQRK